MKKLLVSIFTIIVLTGCGNEKENKETAVETKIESSSPPAAADPVPSVSDLPSFQVVNATNQFQNLADLKGKKIFVNLWATWCGPCRAEIPSIRQLAAKTDPAKTAFIMLSLDDDFETAKAFANKTKMGLPVYYPAGNLPALFNVQSIPSTFIFNEKGELIHQQTGTLNYDTKEFEEMLK